MLRKSEVQVPIEPSDVRQPASALPGVQPLVQALRFLIHIYIYMYIGK